MGIPEENPAVACQPNVPIQKTTPALGQKAAPPSSNSNGNTINIQWQPPGVERTAESTTSHIAIAPQPLQLAVDTPTDWPVVGASVFVGIMGGVVSYVAAKIARRALKEQTRGVTANIRKEWQAELRRQIARYMSLTAHIHFSLELDKDYTSKEASFQAMCDVLEAQTTIEMMLDPNKPTSPRIIEHMEEISRLIAAREVDKLDDAAGRFMKTATEVLEQAWKDIRRDLGHDDRW